MPRKLHVEQCPSVLLTHTAACELIPCSPHPQVSVAFLIPVWEGVGLGIPSQLTILGRQRDPCSFLLVSSGLFACIPFVLSPLKALTFTGVAQGTGLVALITILTGKGTHGVGADSCGADSRKCTLIQVWEDRESWPRTREGCPTQ
jgi:hypothetical protein